MGGRVTIRLATDIAASPDPHDHGWGCWRLKPQTYELEARVSLFVDRPDCRYEVDLEDCRTSAEVLDWVMQVAHKAWASSEVIAGLVHALDDLLQPQGTLCSSGIDKHLTTVAVRSRVAKFAREHPEMVT
jgi:hypothetical protein